MVFNLLVNLLANSPIRIDWQLCIFKVHFNWIIGREFALALRLVLERVLQPLRRIALMGRCSNYLLGIFALVPDVLFHFIEYFHFLLGALSIENLFTSLQQHWVGGLIVGSAFTQGANVVARLRQMVWRVRREATA